MHQPTQEEVEKAQENEYAYLQRRYRIMERDTIAFAGESRTMIQKQLELLKTLHETKKEVMVQVSVAKNPANTVKDDRIAAELSESLQKSDSIDDEIKKRRLYLEEVDREVQTVEKQVDKLRLKSATDYLVQQKLIKSERKIANLENRLYVTNVGFNKVSNDNHKLREEIQHYLRDRTAFTAVHQQLIGKLSEGKKIMLDLIEIATLAYDQREECLGRLNALMEEGEKNRLIRVTEMDNFSRRRDEEVILNTFLGKKGQQRLMQELSDKNAALRAKRKAEKKDLVEYYLGILGDIKVFSGLADYDSIMKLIVSREEENFALYLHVMELNDVLESIQYDVRKLQSEIDEQRREELSRKNKRFAELERLLQERSKRNAEADAAANEMQTNQDQLASLLAGIEELFQSVDGDNACITICLGKNEHPTEHNISKYLEIISSKTIELMEKVSFIEQNSLTEPSSKRLIKSYKEPQFTPAPIDTMAPTQPCAFCVETLEMTKLGNNQAAVLDYQGLQTKLHYDMEFPEFVDRLHNLSSCRLPRSRKILQRRYNS